VITPDDLKRLLAADQKTATMVLIEGRIVKVSDLGA
jgi:hypothetical protein